MSKKKSTSSSETTVNKKGKVVDAKKSKTAKNNRNKGRAFELECIKQIKHIFPDAIRHLEFQKEEAAKGYDISNTDHYDIQCKRGHNYASVLKIEEVQRVMGRVPVLLTRADNKKTIACLYFEDFICLLEDEKNNNDLGQEITQLKHQVGKPIGNSPTPPIMIPADTKLDMKVEAGGVSYLEKEITVKDLV